MDTIERPHHLAPSLLVDHPLFFGAKALKQANVIVANKFYIGELSEFAIFTTPLSQSQIQKIHDANRDHDLTYNFDSETFSEDLKTYIRFNDKLNDTNNSLTYSHLGTQELATLVGTITVDSDDDFPASPPTSIENRDDIFIPFNFPEISKDDISASMTCGNASFPPANAVDHDLDSFSHTKQNCGDQKTSFTFNHLQSFYLSKIKLNLEVMVIDAFGVSTLLSTMIQIMNYLIMKLTFKN